MPAGNNKLNFTKAALDAIAPAPPGQRAYYNDTKVRGLQLLVTERGAKTFYLYRRVAGKPYRYHLGKWPDLPLELARKKAEGARGRAALGADLRAERRKEEAQRITLNDAFEAFKRARTSLKPRTIYDYERYLKVAFKAWADRPLVDITKEKVAARHRQLTDESGPAYADGAMRFLRALVNFSQYQYESPEGAPLLPDNPVRRLSQTRTWNKVKRRTTYITAGQLKPWFAAVLELKANPKEGEAVATADWLQLMLLTGLRRSEALQLAWADVDLDQGTLTVRDTKNHEDHTLPLSDYLHALLKARRPDADKADASPFVFASYGREGHLMDPRKPLAQVIEKSEVTFTAHDLRRTFITVAESLDVPAYALKRLLNHKMRQDVTAGYIISDVERLRKPMQQVTDFMLRNAGLRAPAAPPSSESRAA